MKTSKRDSAAGQPVRCSAWLGGIEGCRAILYMDGKNAVVLVHGKAAVDKLRISKNLRRKKAAAAEAAESREPHAADTVRQSRRAAGKPTRRPAARGKRQPQP
jgi:hypothetical protein